MKSINEYGFDFSMSQDFSLTTDKALGGIREEESGEMCWSYESFILFL